jgi:nitrogen fixation NifU-like protein
MEKFKNTCASLYTPKVMETFKNPHNYGKIKNADGIGKVGNIVCGDVMWLYIKVAKEKKPASPKGYGEAREIIKDIKFETFGCVAAISTSSTITDLAKGKTIKEALTITKDQVIRYLGGLPNIKYHCSVLAVDALVEAIFDYFSKNNIKIPADLKKKHDIIQKSKDIIEKKYKKWAT